jgi:hypothetical protein
MCIFNPNYRPTELNQENKLGALETSELSHRGIMFLDFFASFNLAVVCVLPVEFLELLPIDGVVDG